MHLMFQTYMHMAVDYTCKETVVDTRNNISQSKYILGIFFQEKKTTLQLAFCLRWFLYSGSSENLNIQHILNVKLGSGHIKVNESK